MSLSSLHPKASSLVLAGVLLLPVLAGAQTMPAAQAKPAGQTKPAPAKPSVQAKPAAATPAQPAAPVPLPAGVKPPLVVGAPAGNLAPSPDFKTPRNGIQEIDFFELAAFTYNPKEPYEPAPKAIPNALPEWLKALNGKKVVIRGNATPVAIDNGGVSEFFLANQTDPCGFGTMPRINEWIYVKLTGGRVVDIRAPAGGTVEVLVKGTFIVKEEIEEGNIVSLFNLVADTVQ
jgi:hypothetical protein